MCVVASARLCVVDLATELCSWFFVRYLEFVSVSVDRSAIIREINISVVDYISCCLDLLLILDHSYWLNSHNKSLQEFAELSPSMMNRLIDLFTSDEIYQ